MARRIEIDEDMVTQALSHVSAGMSLRKAAELQGYAITGVLKAIDRYNMGEQYARAMYERAALLAEETLEISDGKDPDPSGDVQRDKLRVDTRKWFAARLDPKRWSERVSVDHSSTDGTMTPRALDASSLSDATLAELLNARKSGAATQ